MTDALADALLSNRPYPEFQKTIEAVSHAPVPELQELSRPEGFAYYALHPVAYARVLDKLALGQHAFVIGIRSIGTTLSAMTAAAARLRQVKVSRMTVRPGGHPYNRETQFTPEQSLAVGDAIGRGADFLIVDEGPGLSGSSFLSVAEALERAGAARERITLICGHQPSPEALCGNDAAQRWRRYRTVSAAAQEPQRPGAARVFVGAGEWRSLRFASSSRWPASWTNLERLKYLSAGERRRFFKFAGLGHYGDPVIEREQAVADAGFGPVPKRESDGFVSYLWLEGHAASAGDLSPQVLDRLAEYCAFRAREFSACNAGVGAVQEMAEHNLAQLGANLSLSLKLERPVITDGRMQPHEWIITAKGEMLKTDSGSHGDDHFFPGPTDIAWDLAGAIVEWRMEPRQAKEFLDCYYRASGDDAGPRIEGFIRAYTAFRWAYCSMAANAMRGTPDQARLEAAAECYAAILQTSAAIEPISASVAR
ncbi:MAG TPA: hypothetical protein VFR84_06975 [Candidatus Angelobacter sp.]|nr:hypothetical protein [Candidatus Angelobacter sp.]